MDDVALAMVERFGMLEDPRTGHARRHELLDIIVITLCAVICDADNWVEIEEFGKDKEDWFRRFPNGIPSHLKSKARGRVRVGVGFRIRPN